MAPQSQGYVSGYRSIQKGVRPASVIWAGILSNSAASLLLLAYHHEWSTWHFGGSPVACGFLWFSMVITGLIAAGLIVFGVLPGRAAAP